MAPNLFSPLSNLRYPLIQIPKDKNLRSADELINANLKNHNFYLDPSWDVIQYIEKDFKPEGLLCVIYPYSTPLTPELENQHLKMIKNFSNWYTITSTQYNDPEEKDFYSQLLESLGIYFYKKLKKYHLSKLHLSLSNALQPGVVNVLNGLASCLLQLNEFSEAKKYLEEALAVDPANINSREILGQIYLNTKQYDYAFKCYQEILKKNAKSRLSHFGIGICLIKKGKLDQAAKSFQKVISLSSEEDSLTLKAKKHLLQLKKIQ
jgi:tetratricopeptide (TPR) repeat protein